MQEVDRRPSWSAEWRICISRARQKRRFSWYSSRFPLQNIAHLSTQASSLLILDHLYPSSNSSSITLSSRSLKRGFLYEVHGRRFRQPAKSASSAVLIQRNSTIRIRKEYLLPARTRKPWLWCKVLRLRSPSLNIPTLALRQTISRTMVMEERLS